MEWLTSQKPSAGWSRSPSTMGIRALKDFGRSLSQFISILLVNISLKFGFVPKQIDSVLVPHQSPIEQDQAHENSPRLISIMKKDGDGQDHYVIIIFDKIR